MEVTQTKLAEILGVSTRWIRDLENDKKLFADHKKNKKYNLAGCVQEYLEFKIESETVSGKTGDYWDEKAEHEKAKRKITEIKLSKMKRETFTAADVEYAWSAILIAFKDKALSIAQKLAPLVTGKDDMYAVASIIGSEVSLMLEDLSEFSLDMIESEEEVVIDDEEDEPKPEPVSKKGSSASKPAKKGKGKSVGGKKQKANK